MSSIDPRTVSFVAGKEGRVLRAYRCPAGVITIGFGFTMGSKVFAEWWRSRHGRALRLGDTIALNDALYLLRKVLIAEYAAHVFKAAPKAKPNEAGAAASMLYNCGLGATKWRWFKALVKGDIKDAAAKLRVTAVTARGRRLPGLVTRRIEEAAIMEVNRWPSWVKAPANDTIAATLDTVPAWRLESDDHVQGLLWLRDLGFLGRDSNADQERAAVLAFQREHKQLTNDGILGRATLDQIQRVIDLKRKAKQVAATGSVPVAGGVTIQTVDLASEIPEALAAVPDWMIWFGLAGVVAGLVWLFWRYRDEVAIALKPRQPAA